MSETNPFGKLGLDLGIGVNTPIEVIVRAVADVIQTDRKTMDPLNRFKIDAMRVVFLELMLRIITAPAVATGAMPAIPANWSADLELIWNKLYGAGGEVANTDP